MYRSRCISPEEKFIIVKQVLTNVKSIKEVITEYGIQPEEYYLWLSKFYEGALDNLRRCP